MWVKVSAVARPSEVEAGLYPNPVSALQIAEEVVLLAWALASRLEFPSRTRRIKEMMGPRDGSMMKTVAGYGARQVVIGLRTVH